MTTQANTETLNINFVRAERTAAHEVKAYYTLDGIEFAALWNCIHAGTGEVMDYDLRGAESQDKTLEHRIEQAIRGGEDGEDDELYLAIRDTFGSSDAEFESYNVVVDSVTAYEAGGGYEAEVTIKGELFKVHLQLPNTADSQHSVLEGGSLHPSALDEIADKAETKFLRTF